MLNRTIECNATPTRPRLSLGLVPATHHLLAASCTGQPEGRERRPLAPLLPHVQPCRCGRLAQERQPDGQHLLGIVCNWPPHGEAARDVRMQMVEALEDERPAIAELRE